MVGGIGCWLSSFTLAATEVTERAELPWLTLSYSDLITSRGFKYVFQSSPTADAQATALLPRIVDLATKATGRRSRPRWRSSATTRPPSVSFMKPHPRARGQGPGPHDRGRRGLHPAARRRDDAGAEDPLRAARLHRVPVHQRAATTSCCSTSSRSGGSRPATIPLIGGGGHWCVPELMKVAGKEHLEGMIVGLANWPGKAVERRREALHRQDRRAVVRPRLDLPLRARDDLQGGPGARRRPPTARRWARRCARSTSRTARRSSSPTAA